MRKLVDITKGVTAKRGIIVPSQLPQSRRQLHGYQLMLEASQAPNHPLGWLRLILVAVFGSCRV